MRCSSRRCCWSAARWATASGGAASSRSACGCSRWPRSGCALAGDGAAADPARAVQGIGGALLVPGSLALISAHFPKKERGRGHRHLVGRERHHRGDRAGAGRLPGRPLFVDLGLSGQCADGAGGAVDRVAPCAGKPRQRRRQRAGLCWGAALATIGAGRHRLCLHRSADAGLASPAVLAALALGIGRSVAFVVGGAARPGADAAAVAVAHRQFRRRQPADAAAVCGARAAGCTSFRST